MASSQGEKYFHVGTHIVSAIEDRESINIVIHVVWETRVNESQEAIETLNLGTISECPILRASEQGLVEGQLRGKTLKIQTVFVYI